MLPPLRLPGTTRPASRGPVLRFVCVDSGNCLALSVTHSDGVMSLSTTGGTWDRGDAAGRQRLIDKMANFLRMRGVEGSRTKVMEFLAEQEVKTGHPLL